LDSINEKFFLKSIWFSEYVCIPADKV